MITQYFRAGTDISISLDFFNGDYFVPDIGSVKYTLYDNAGNPVSGQTNVPVTTTSTTTKIVITIPASYNTLSSGLMTFKKLVVSYTLSGSPYDITIVYKLYSELNTWVTPDDVRKILGVNNRELPDSDIDIVEAYYKVRQILGPTTFNSAINSTGIEVIYVNNAIRAMAALDTLPGLKFRLTHKESDGSLTYQRLQNVDLDSIAEDLKQDLDRALNSLDPQPITADTAYTIFELSVRTDPFTGS